MARESAFGAEPEQLRELLSLGLEDRSERADALTAPLGVVLERPGGQIGRYRLLSILGEGGMGVVYLAEQHEPIRRQVALKVIKPGMDSKRVIARFEAERQALALLEHPNIAQVHDAGATKTGRPFFVMEYVRGLPITEHCDRHKLSVDDRLKLFQTVCHAAQHAHQKGIIHRDLKPSNILVTVEDGQPIPKIIDFGVAKAIGKPLTEGTLFSEDSQLLGTPEYMSPEQADMANEDIDTRSDIYSLGVLLYVLLTGVLPFDSTTFREGGIEHIRQTIREVDPKTPSTRLLRLGEAATKIAESRSTKLEVLARRLHRELEWIPLKAMRKERAERYRSASELADDIENYLGGDPLMAGPESGIYRIKKFVRRRRALVAGVASVLAVLIVGVITSTLFAIKAEYARAEVQAVSDFLRNNVLASMDPYKLGGTKITIRSVLDAASKSLEGEFKGTPLAEAEIRETLGNAYWSLGVYGQADSHLRRALDIQQAQRGLEDLGTLATLHRLGWVCFARSRYREAGELLLQGYQTRSRLWGEELPDTLYSAMGLACVYNRQGRLQEAEQLARKALETTRRVLDPEHEYVPGFANILAWNDELRGRYEEAIRRAENGRKMSHRVLGPNHWFTLLLTHTCGRICVDLARYDRAQQYLFAALDGKREVWGQEHPDTLETRDILGWLYYRQGRYEQAESEFTQTLEIMRRVLGDVHLFTADCLHGRGSLYLDQKRYDEAEPLLDEASETMSQLLGRDNQATLEIMNTLARLYTKQKRYHEAQSLFNETLGARQRKLGQDHPATLESRNDLAVLYKEQGQHEEAKGLLTQALQGRRENLGPDHPACFESMHELAILYIVQARYEEAEQLLKDAFHGRQARLGPEHPHTIESLKQLVHLYDSWNKPDRASEYRARLARISDGQRMEDAGSED